MPGPRPARRPEGPRIGGTGPSRRVVVAGLAFAGCGFTPVYGPGGVAKDLFGQIDIDPPNDASGFAFVRELERQLGIAETPVYRLSADLRIEEDELGVTIDQEITRYHLIGQARYSLVDMREQKSVMSGMAETFTSYSATGTTVSTRAARTDARDRLMIALANQVVGQLLASSGDWA